MAGAGLSGERVLLAVADDPSLKFSGRAIQKLTDTEFGFLSRNSIAVASASYQRLKLTGTGWIALETFLNQLDSLLIRLKGTPEYPSNVNLMTLLEDQIEAQVTQTSASFAAFRQKELDGENPPATDLIKMLKARCLKHREKQQREQATKSRASSRGQKTKTS